MTDRLAWRAATFEDRRSLQGFVCAQPENRVYDSVRGRYHPQPWAWEVQGHIRSLRSPVPADETVMLGVDAEGIAAVAHLGFDLDHRDFMIYAVARAVRCAGLGYGRAAVQVALDICQATKTEQRLDARVYAKVHRQNMASLSVLAGFDFEYVRVFGDGYELWVRELA